MEWAMRAPAWEVHRENLARHWAPRDSRLTERRTGLRIRRAPLTSEATLALRLASAPGSGYQIPALVGRGGVVCHASDRRLRREVAIKVLPPQVGHAPEARARFVREAQMGPQLFHPNIVPVYAVGERDNLV